MTLQKETDHRK